MREVCSGYMIVCSERRARLPTPISLYLIFDPWRCTMTPPRLSSSPISNISLPSPGAHNSVFKQLSLELRIVVPVRLIDLLPLILGEQGREGNTVVSNPFTARTNVGAAHNESIASTYLSNLQSTLTRIQALRTKKAQNSHLATRAANRDSHQPSPRDPTLLLFV